MVLYSIAVVSNDLKSRKIPTELIEINWNCESWLLAISSFHVLPAMIAQWDSSLSVLSVARVQFPATAEYFKGTRHELAWQKMAQSPLNDTTQPVDSEEEGRSPTTDRRWLIEKNSRPCSLKEKKTTPRLNHLHSYDK